MPSGYLNELVMSFNQDNIFNWSPTEPTCFLTLPYCLLSQGTLGIGVFLQ